MSMLQRLRSVYFETVRLEASLGRLPTEVADWHSHPVVPGAHPESALPMIRAGLVAPVLARLRQNVETLRSNLLLLEIDLQEAIDRVRPEEISAGQEPHLFLLKTEISVLHSLIDQLEFGIPLLGETTALQTSEFTSQNQIKLRNCLLQIKRAVKIWYGKN